MRLLSGRWRTLLIYYLIDGPKRFGELRRDIGQDLTNAMLTLELRQLEDAGVINTNGASPAASRMSSTS